MSDEGEIIWDMGQNLNLFQHSIASFRSISEVVMMKTSVFETLLMASRIVCTHDYKYITFKKINFHIIFQHEPYRGVFTFIKVTYLYKSWNHLKMQYHDWSIHITRYILCSLFSKTASQSKRCTHFSVHHSSHCLLKNDI